MQIVCKFCNVLATHKSGDVWGGSVCCGIRSNLKKAVCNNWKCLCSQMTTATTTTANSGYPLLCTGAHHPPSHWVRSVSNTPKSLLYSTTRHVCRTTYNSLYIFLSFSLSLCVCSLFSLRCASECVATRPLRPHVPCAILPGHKTSFCMCVTMLHDSSCLLSN